MRSVIAEGMDNWSEHPEGTWSEATKHWPKAIPPRRGVTSVASRDSPTGLGENPLNPKDSTLTRDPGVWGVAPSGRSGG